MKILVFTYNFKPDTSPTAYCLELLLEELKSIYDITVVTSTVGLNNEISTQSDEKIKVIRIPDPLRDHNMKVIKRIEKFNFFGINSLSKGFKYFNSFLNRIYYFFHPDGGYFWRKRVGKELGNVVDIGEYTIFLSSIGLYSTFALAEDMKKNNKNVKIISYLNDPLPINNPFVVNVSHLYNSKYMSYRCVEKSSYIIANKSIYQKYTTDYFSKYDNKIHEIDIPLLKNSLTSGLDSFDFKGNNNSIKIVYSGSFYKEIRNPIAPITRTLTANKNISLHIMGNLNDCEGIFSELSREFPDQIFFYGSVSRDLLFSALNSADYLLNIGNHLENQVPSKLFEYMATGKPIIHYYTLVQDTCLPYLNKYGLSLAINLREEGGIDSLNDFVSNNMNKKIPFDTISSIFLKNTPHFAAQKISDLINEMS